jgi:hypothetical protein
VATRRRTREPCGRVRSLAGLVRALVAAGALVVVGAVPAGAAPGANRHEPPPPVDKVTVSNPAPTRDSAIDVFSSGWEPGSSVAIALAGSELGRVRADAGGLVRTEVRMPPDAHAGFGVLTVTGASASGVPQQMVTGLSVVVDHAPPSSSPRPWVAISLVLALATVLLLVSQRVGGHDTRLAS